VDTLPKLVRLALPLLISACSSGEDCRPAVLDPVDDVRSCVLPASEVAGLQFCHAAGAVRTKGIRPICVSDAKGKQYVGYIATDEHISGSGFLTSDDCNFAPPSDSDGGCPP
jgi:hypothetical protein